MQAYLDNFLASIGNFLPGVLGTLAILIIGWFIAIIFRNLTAKMLKKTNLDNRIMSKTGSSVQPEAFIAKLVYYLIMLIVLMAVLDRSGAGGALDPLKNMVNEFLGYIPNMVAAGIIGFAGYMIATIASELVSFAGESADRFSNKLGLVDTNIDLSQLLKKVVFFIIFVPMLIVALDTLGFKTISEPAKEMLSSMMNAIPNIIAAALIIGVFYIVGKFVVGFLTDLLRSLGVDDYSQKLGLGNVIGTNQSLSKIAGNLAFFFLMFTGVITAVDQLNFGQLSGILNNLFEMTGQIFFGLVIMAVGNYISTIAQKAMEGNNPFLGTLVRVATLGMFLAIALRTMGIANDIVNLAFGLILGAVAVAFALSFGLGGREAAGKQMEDFFRKFRG